MDCLIDFIGYENVGAGFVPSGININALPGITTDMINKIMEPEQGSPGVMWYEIQHVAAKRLYSDLVSKLSAAYQIKTIREAVGFKPAADASFSIIPIDPANEYGLKIGFRRELRSLAAISISKLLYVSPDQYNATVRIYDENHTVLFESVTDVNQGFNSIEINQVFTEDNLYLSVSAGPFARFHSTKIAQADESCFCKAIRKCCGSNHCEPSLAGTMWNGFQWVDQGVETYGVGFSADLTCDYSAIVCRNKPLFTSIWLYLLGNQLLIELASTSRVNQPTTVDRDQYIELRDHYQLEYEKQLETIVKGINLSDSCCVVCNPPVKRKSWVP